MTRGQPPAAGAAASAFLALWNGVSSAALVPEYEAWHTIEHVPERVGSPGFVAGVRYRSVEDPLRYFTCYWLRSLDALSTPAYQDLLDHPTPWSARMRSELRDFLRMPCELAGSIGVSSASRLAVLQLDFAAGAEAAVRRLQPALQRQADAAGLVCAHWGLCRPRDGHPIANPPAAAPPALVVLLQHQDLAVLRRSTEAVVHALVAGEAVVRLRGGPVYHEQLSEVRQAALQAPLSRRQPARTDLFHAFNTGDDTA